MPSSHRSPSDIYPSLSYTDAPAAIHWLCRAFGFTKRFVVAGEGGRVEHSELSLGTGVVMVGSAKPDQAQLSPKDLGGHAHGLSVFVEDPDAHFQMATAAGANPNRLPLRAGAMFNWSYAITCHSMILNRDSNSARSINSPAK